MGEAAGSGEYPYLKALGGLEQPAVDVEAGTERCRISYVWMQCPRLAVRRVTAGCIGERLTEIPVCDVCLDVMRIGGVLCVKCGLTHPLVLVGEDG